MLTEIFVFDNKDLTKYIKDGLFNIIFPNFFYKVSKFNTQHQFYKDGIEVLASEYQEWAEIYFNKKKSI